MPYRFLITYIDGSLIRQRRAGQRKISRPPPLEQLPAALLLLQLTLDDRMRALLQERLHFVRMIAGETGPTVFARVVGEHVEVAGGLQFVQQKGLVLQMSNKYPSKWYIPTYSPT